MAEHPPPPSHSTPDQSAATGTARPAEYPNPPEPGWLDGPRFPNPPDPSNPDPATLREQWLFAIRRYSRWYSRAWGAAILAGGALFALGWAIKGDNPMPSSHRDDDGKAAGASSNKS